MKKATAKVLPVICVVTFAVTATTSIPLFVPYLRGETMKNAVLQDVHVWFGIAFTISVLLRMAFNKKFVVGSLKQLTRRR
ncbi:MAG: hypothetical protein ACLFU9_02040 [Candidatus Bathyarchaeia archaeon]